MTKLKDLLLSKLSEFDATLDISEGSPLLVSVVEPIVELFGATPLDSEVIEFITAKLEEAFPDITVTPGDAIYDILITSVSLFFEAYRSELKRIANSQSVSNIDSLSDADADALAANWLVSRNTGSLASCRAQIVFSSPKSVRLDSTNLFYTSDGLLFQPDGTYVISAGSMRDNVLGADQFFLDINVIAVEAGSKYNIGTGAIVGITGLSGYVSVTNTTAGLGGLDRDTNNSLLLSKLPSAVSERSMVTPRGIQARIYSSFPSVNNITVIGFGDQEMDRDRASSMSDGPTVFSGFAFLHAESKRVILCYSDASKEIKVGYTIKVIIPPSSDHSLVSAAEAAYTLSIASIELPKSTVSIIPRTVTAVCTVIEDIPNLGEDWVAGYISVHDLPNIDVGGELVNRAKHLGGNTDVYIHTLDDISSSVDIPVLIESLVYIGNGITTSEGSNSIFVSLDATHTYTVFKRGMIFKIQGVDTLYEIERVTFYDNKLTLFVDKALDTTYTSAAQNRWYLYDTVDSYITKSDKQVLPVGNNTLVCTAPVGVSTLRLSSSDEFAESVIDLDNRVYTIQIDIDGATATFGVLSFSNTEVVINSPLRSTLDNAPCKIFEVTSSVSKPLTHIESVQIGSRVLPYAKSYGARPINMGGAKTKQTGLVGLVLPSYNKMFSKLATPLLSSLDMDFDTYITLLSSSYGNTLGNELPFSYGVGRPEERSCILRYKYSLGAQDYYGEALFPLELFTSGPNNIFAAIGNTTFSEVTDYLSSDQYNLPLNMSPPVNALRGDTIEIGTGKNRGEYIIDKVYQIELKLSPSFDNVDIETYLGSREEFEGVSGDPNLLIRRVETSKIIRLSLVRVVGSFLDSPFSMFEDAFTLTHTPNEASPSDNVLDLSDLLRMIMDPSGLVPENVPSLSSLNDASMSRLGIPTIAELPVISSQLVSRNLDSYSVGSPAKGTLRIYFEDSPYIGLPTLFTPNITHSSVNKHLFNLSEGLSSELELNSNFFYCSRLGKTLTLDLDTTLGSLIYADSGADINDPTTWSRDLDISNVSVDAPPGYYIEETILLNGITPLPLGQDESRIGLDLITLPSRYALPITEFSLNQNEELHIHKEAVFPDYPLTREVFATPRFSVFSSSVDLDFEGFVGEDPGNAIPCLVVRKGIPYVEPKVLHSSYVPDWWLGDPSDLAAINTALVESREAASTLVYLRLNNIVDLEAFIYDNVTVADGVDALSCVNREGLTLLEVLQQLRLEDPSAFIALHSNESIIAGLPSDVNNFITTPTPYITSSLTDYNAADKSSGMLVGKTTVGSNTIQLVSPLSDYPSDLNIDTSHIGAYLFIESGPDSGGYTIQSIDADAGTVTVDKTLTYSTEDIVVKGVIGIDTNADFKTLHMGQGSVSQLSDEGDFIPRLSTVSPTTSIGGPLLGASSRLLTRADIGKYITLYNYVRRPDSEIYPDLTQFTPIRTHLGTFKVSDVILSRATDSITGDTIHIASQVLIDEAIDSAILGETLRDFEEVFFLLTNDPVPPEDGEVKSCVPIHIYETEPTRYKIIGYQPDIAGEQPNTLAVATIGYDSPSSVESLGLFEAYESSVDANDHVNISMDIKNPFALIRTDLFVASSEGTEMGLSYVDVAVQSMGHSSAYNDIKNEVFPTYNEIIDGYLPNVDVVDNSYTTEESTSIIISPKFKLNHRGLVGDDGVVLGSDEVTVNYVSSPTVQSVQALTSVGSERVVCSDIRVKRMMPAYVGAELMYTGPALALDILDAVKKVIQNTIITGGRLSPNTLVTTAYSKGATAVNSCNLYYYVIDKSRRRFLELVDTELSSSTTTIYDGTIRTTSITPASLDSTTLSTSIDVQKSSVISRIGRRF